MTESQQYGAVWNDQIREGSRLVAITDRAQENMNYVHRLLKTNQPEFAALLERLEREWSCPRCAGSFLMTAAGSTRAPHAAARSVIKFNFDRTGVVMP